MKLTNEQLIQIIKEEIDNVMNEAPAGNYIIEFSGKGATIRDSQGVFGDFHSIDDEYTILFNVARTNKNDPEMFDKLIMLIEKLRPAAPRPQPDDVRFKGLENVFRRGQAFQ